MNKLLDAKIKMFFAEEDNYLALKARYDVVPAMDVNMETFLANNAQIRLLLPLSMETTKPTTEDRDFLLEKMCESAVVVSKAVQSYADSAGDFVLEYTMNWSVRKLLSMRKDQVGPVCVSIHTKGTELLVQATPFGLTQAKLDELEDDTAAWTAKETATRNKQVAIGEYNRQVAQLVRDNMRLLTRRLDRMVYTLTESDPEAVSLWDENRRVIAFPTTETQAKVTVKDGPDGLAVFEAEVLLVNGNEFRAVTDLNGEALYKPLKKGYYSLRVTAPGFVPFVLPQMRVYLGRINRFDVGLLPDA